MVVAGNRPFESLYPKGAGPLSQVLSSKFVAIHAVPWSEPSSRYFQTEENGSTSERTPMLTGCELYTMPASERPTAVMRWEPGVTLVQTAAYGALASWPIFTLSTKNSMLVMVPDGK